MKALTISQPFASLIASGEKFVENRTWETLYRGPLAIHAGKGTQYLTKQELAEYPTGAIVAVARLVACYHLESLDATRRHEKLHSCELTIGDILRHKHTEGPFCWVLSDVKKLPEPIPCRGAQGLWDLPRGVLTESKSERDESRPHRCG